MGYDGSVKFDTSVDVTGFTSGVSKLKNLATSYVSTITKIFTTAVTAVSAGFIAAGTAATKVGSEFEAAMSKVSAVSGATGKDLDTLTEKAKEMGATTQFSASQSAEAFQYMAMAGWDTEQMLNGIDGIMSLSAADGLDLATTSDIVTDALTAFGLAASDSTHFADVLATASSSANTNVSMLGESFKYVAPLAGAMNYSVEDVSLALGLMANASVKGSMAGTSLKTALANLSSPTDDMAKSLMQLGLATEVTSTKIDQLKIDKAANKVKSAQEKYNTALEKYGEESTQAETAALNLKSAEEALAVVQAGETETVGYTVSALKNADGSTKSLKETLVDLRKAFATLDETQQAEYASTIFGKEAMSGMLAIINASEDDFNKLANSIDNADGTAQKMADTMNDNLKGKITIMKSALEGLGITIYEQIEDKLKTVVEKGTKYIDRLSKAFENGGLEEAIQEAGKMFGELATEIAGYTPDILNAAVGFIKAFVQGIRDNKDKVFEAAKEIVVTIKDTFLELLPDSIQEPVESMLENLESALGSVVTAFADAFSAEDIGNAITGIIDFISELVEVITDFVKKVAPPFSDALKTIKNAFASTGFQNAVKKIKDTFKIFGDTAASIAKAVLPIFADALSGLLENLDKVLLIIQPLIIGIGSLKIASMAMKCVEGLSVALSSAGSSASGLFAILEAHPFVAIATAIGMAITELAKFFAYTESGYYQNQQLAESWKETEREMEKAEESLSNLGKALNMDDEWNAWIDNLGSAKSSLDNLSESQIFDTEKMSSIETQMEDIQKQINYIAGTYSDERKKLTDNEIQKLEDLFSEMKKLSNQELDLIKKYQSVANTQAEGFTSGFDGTGAEYLEEMQTYVKGAAEARDKVLDAAKEAYDAELLNIGEIQWSSAAARRKAEDEAYNDYEEQKKAAQESYAQTITILQKGYKQQSNIIKNSVEKAVELKQSYKDIVSSATQSQQNMRELYEKGELSWEEYSQKMSDIGDRMAVSIQNWGNTTAETFSDTEKKELGSWLAMIRTTQEQGAELDEETANVCVALAESFGALPPETKESMGELYDGVMEIVGDLPNDVREQAEKMFQETIGTFEKENPNVKAVSQKTADAILDPLQNMKPAGEKISEAIVDGMIVGMNAKITSLIQTSRNLVSKLLTAMKGEAEVNSPSRATKRIFGYVIDGCVLGITENQDKVFKSASDMASETLSCIGDHMGDTVMNAKVALNANTDNLLGTLKEKLANTEFAAKLKAAVVAESASISGVLTGRTVNSTTISSENSRKINVSGNVTTHINIDGREFAIAVSPFLDEEMAFV